MLISRDLEKKRTSKTKVVGHPKHHCLAAQGAKERGEERATETLIV